MQFSTLSAPEDKDNMINYIIKDCEQFSRKTKDEMFDLIAEHVRANKDLLLVIDI